MQIAAVLVDWGTSHLRMWAVDCCGGIVGEDRSAEGMGATAPSAFAGVLETHLDRLGAPADTPVMMCGMVGARQGWLEAPYVDVPACLDTLVDRAVHVQVPGRDIRILPGIADRSAETPDVMRSEETQLLGLCTVAPEPASRLVCMPGTHAKWVEIDGAARQVRRFATALTGELYAALGTSTVLRHSLGTGSVDADHPRFAEAVAASLERPETILTRLFAIRPHALLRGEGEADARARLSGTIIGQDIAGAIARFGRPGRVVLVGGGRLGALYERALDLAGIAPQIHDGEALARAGLLAAAGKVWPHRLGGANPTQIAV
ncbi:MULTISPECIES: 2-dehydro-3-deoxygalactonokinase [unclassified Roseitalea]|uniref:2-dehydro-3-deoxygalactonokinase n=1 Tax=unclassified Roseitalea TaxID=2639107 RepID=UPI00273E7624|nr:MULTISPECIES: 2-dehydro-3-deoxygalactonokinase [unclassified Roseitalea]